MRVLIVDQHPVIRDGLKAAFGITDDIEVVGEAGSGEEAIKLAQDLSPDVVFTDVRLPGMNGIQAARIIRERRPDTKVILLTTDESRASVSEAIQAGVSGYLLKDAGVTELVNAGRMAMAGKAAIHPTLTQAFIEEVQLVDRKPSEVPLSPREFEILQKVAYGATTKEVANQIGVSFQTVKTHLERIVEKLGANNRAEAVAWMWYGGDMVQLCEKHRCCYEVTLRHAAGLPLNRAGEWHFRWVKDARKWHLHYPARRFTTERDVPKGGSPPASLAGAIPGKAISHIAGEIERLGFPPPDC